MSPREVAGPVGVSICGIHSVISALFGSRLLKLSNITATEDKRRYAYLLTPEGVEEKIRLTRRFILRKMAEYDALRSEVEEIRADLPKRDLHAFSGFKGY